MLIEMHTLAYGNEPWMEHCLPTLRRYAELHECPLREWTDEEGKDLPHPKFIIGDLLRGFLSGDSDQCLWVDADIVIERAAPLPELETGRRWMAAPDAKHESYRRSWSRWCDQNGLPVRPYWKYRNAGVWLCDRAGAEAMLSVMLPPFRVGIMDQHQMNHWWAQLGPEMVGELPKTFNRCVKHDLGRAWFHHLCGVEKMDYLSRLYSHQPRLKTS